MAAAVAATGAHAVIGSRSEGSVERALTVLPANVTGRPVDVTAPGSLASFLAAAGDFDHLVYTAGDDLMRATVAEYDPVRAAAFFDIRLFRALDAVRLARPALSPTGSITLTSGAAAFHGGPGRSLAVELAPVRVNVVAHGVVRTPLWADAPEALLDQLGAGTLLGRVAEPADVAKTAAVSRPAAPSR